MRTLFDGFWWVRGPVSNAQVMREIILAWVEEFPEDDLVVAVPRANLDKAREDLPPSITLVPTRLRPQGISAMVELPIIGRRHAVDAIFSHNFTPLFGPAAVFIHDLMFVTHPYWFTRMERIYFAFMPLSARRARWVFTSTNTEAERIAQLTSRERRVVSTGLGISGELDRAVPAEPSVVAGVSGFLLSVGRLNARKNLRMTIDGSIASGLLSSTFPLVIVGEPGGRSADLPESAAAAVASGAVRFAGFVQDDELAWLYAHASAFLFLSLDEGFGLPTLESVRFGAPVVASDIAVFHEVLRSHGRYVASDDAAAIGGAIREAVASGRPAPADVSAELGYSWAESVRRIRTAIASG